MTLDEVSELFKQIKSVPINEVIKDIEHHNTLTKYTKHSKKLQKHKNNLIILEEFKELYDVVTREKINCKEMI